MRCRTSWRRCAADTARRTAATSGIVALTLAVTLAQFRWPVVLESLRRSPEALASGQVWRLLSPLLVHADGAGQLAFNLVLVGLAASAAERRFGAGRMLLIYVIGGLAGNLAGYGWEPTGAGASVGAMGLLGALAADALRRGQADLPALVVGLATLAALGAAPLARFAGTGAAIAVGAAAAALARHRPGLSGPVLSWALLAAAAAVTLMADQHGPPVLAGALAAAALRTKTIPPR
jgi:membrane associated rhomboid family serine protease